MTDAGFQDHRLSNREMPLRGAGQCQPLADFVVFVRGDDDRVRRYRVPSASRFLAAKEGENSLRIREQRDGLTIAVLRFFDPSHPSGVGDECLAPCEFTILVENPRAIRTTVSVWADERLSAIAAATRRFSGGRPLSGQIRFRGIGRCASCRVTLFADMKTRETPRGLKCADCW